MEARIKGTTQLLCLIGTPVGHSGSPAMHNFAFAHHGLDYAYLAFDITEEQAPEAMKALKLLGAKGFNVTMPCKNIVAKNVDEISPEAEIIGACNTVVNENGRWKGYITDGTGFVLNLRDHGVDVKGKKILVCGAGGAATAIQVQCAFEGAEAVTIFNGNDPFLDRARETAAKLAEKKPECKIEVHCLDEKEVFETAVKEADIFVNGTSVGMKPHEDGTLITDSSLFREDLVVCDVVYNPKETRLMREAKAAGCAKVIGGEGMLLWQGVAAFKLWTGKDFPVKEWKEYQGAN
ncbi:MAG: shikimate dehydrogenase [Eubacterium sp.]|nr:shikimate dehydrogenase [Eubacterium sp.]